MGIRDRFLSKIDKGKDGCWHWTGAKFKSGYGLFRTPDQKGHRAHRLSFEFHTGPIPVGMEVCHTCNVKDCVNPAHLFAGTHQVNVAQAGKDGLLTHGIDHHRAKLLPDQIQIIRTQMGGHPLKGRQAQNLGNLYGVNRTTIAAIAANKTWKEV